MGSDSHSDSEIKEFYQLKNIAVVGVSKNEEKPSHQVPKYLIERGYNVIPVNPTAVVDDILKKKDGIKVIWMQLGIYNEDAEKKAKQNGIDVIYNRCMMEEHRRLFDDKE
jgi:uncharacterized protein